MHARGEMRIILDHQHARGAPGSWRALMARLPVRGGPGEHETAPPARRPRCARSTRPLGELHQAPHDEQPEAGAVVAAAAARMQRA